MKTGMFPLRLELSCARRGVIGYLNPKPKTLNPSL